MRPLQLTPNFVQRFYRGGEAIASLRGVPWPNEYVPEDWLGSATSVWDDSSAGVTRLPDDRLLGEALAAEPEAFLGPDHVAHHGASPALLVKLLEGAERLPIHYHPSREFALRRLGATYGKTEAWYVVDPGNGSRTVHIGFREDADPKTVARWVAEQDAEAMLEALLPVEVQAGDAIFVPAGIPHAIGAGILILELQEPSDLSVLMEWEGYEVDGAAEGHLGLGFAAALRAIDLTAMTPERLRQLSSSAAEREANGTAARPFPLESESYFRAELVEPGAGSTRLDPGFSVLLALAGEGELRGGEGEPLKVSAGDALLVPFAAGEQEVRGEGLRLLRSRPPA